MLFQIVRRCKTVTFDNFCAISLARALERHRATQFLKTATTSTLSNRNCFKLLVKTITASPICTVSVIQILDDADVAFRISGAELRTVLSATIMLAVRPHRLNGRTSAQRFCVLTILPPVTALAVGLPAQRAIAQRFRALALFGPHVMSDLSPECAP